MRSGILLVALLMAGCLDSLGSNEPVIPDEWPEGAPRLQPGSQIYFVEGNTVSQCTAGFLFASPDNQTLYLSTAAHCLPSSQSGAAYDRVPGARTKSIGNVAYSGWNSNPGSIPHDFALVAVSNREGVRENTSPAIKQWGGPTGLADSTTGIPGTQVAAYGAAGSRGADHPDNARLGRFVINNGNELAVRLDVRAIPGDSGGPLMTWDGQALGLLHGVLSTTLPLPIDGSVDIFVPLDANLERARNQIPGLQLVVWDDFSGPSTPLV